jgi:hypothetical protein
MAHNLPSRLARAATLSDELKRHNLHTFLEQPPQLSLHGISQAMPYFSNLSKISIPLNCGFIPVVRCGPYLRQGGADVERQRRHQPTGRTPPYVKPFVRNLDAMATEGKSKLTVEATIAHGDSVFGPS